MNPFTLLSDRRGRLYEIPLLIAFACVSLAIGVGQRSWWKGPAYAALGFGAVFGALFAFVAVMDWLEGVPSVRAFRESRFAETLSCALAYLVGLVGGAALGGFVAIFAAAYLAESPEGRLRAMRAIAAAGALLGAAVVFGARRRPARF